jgi:Tol biopolymer transport system component
VTGKALDARSDLFSLGVVLYEMLSGKRPFQKGTAAETMAAILKEEPPELSGTDKPVPPGLDRIVRHCLEKDTAARFQTARDLGFDLESLSQATTAGTATFRDVKGRRRALSAAAFILLAGALFAVGAYVHSRSVNPVQPRIKRLTFQRGQITTARFLPDGQSVVYAAAWGDEPLELYSVRLDSPESRLIGFRDADLRAVARGSDVALGLDAGKRLYHTGTGPGTLAVAPFSGGAPRAVAENVIAADFSPDGRRMAAVVDADRLEYPLGTALRHVGPAFWIDRLRISPGGDRVAFVEHPRQTTEGTVTVTAPGGKTTKLTRHFTDMGGIAWSPGGDEVWFSGADEGFRSEIWAVNMSGRERRVFAGLGSVLLHDIGRDGRVLVSTLDKARRIFFGSADHFADRDLSWFDQSEIWGLSHDGRVLLFSEDGEGVGSSNTLFVRETDGSPPVKIGPHPHGEGVNLSADGRFVVVARLRPPAIDVIPVGAGATRTIPLSGFEEAPLRRAGLMADGKTVWFEGSRPREGLRIWITDVAGATPHPASPEIVRGFRTPLITPDEKSFVARVRSDRGAATSGTIKGTQVALIPRTGGEPRIVPDLSGEDSIAGIAQDARSLFVYRYGSGFPVAIRRVDVETGRSELLREISPPDRVGVVSFNIMVTPDGQHYAYNTVQRLGDLYVIDGLR